MHAAWHAANMRAYYDSGSCNCGLISDANRDKRRMNKNKEEIMIRLLRREMALLRDEVISLRNEVVLLRNETTPAHGHLPEAEAWKLLSFDEENLMPAEGMDDQDY